MEGMIAMIDQKMQEALNKQLNAELYSSYLYLSMAAYFLSVNLGGFANWMRVQTQEEAMHAMKFYDYINERGGRVLLQPVEAPPSEWDSPLAVFEHIYSHEQAVTGMINKLVDLAIKASDHATSNFLQWFVSEQVEEEASADEVVQKLRLVGDDPGALFMIDRELAQRVFVAPAATTEGGTE
jgi:ferritin